MRQDDFWQDFQYGIKQSNLWIEPRAVHGEAEYGDVSLGSGLLAPGSTLNMTQQRFARTTLDPCPDDPWRRRYGHI